MSKSTVETIGRFVGIISIIVGGTVGFYWGENIHSVIWNDWRSLYQQAITGTELITRLFHAVLYIITSLYTILPSIVLYDLPQFILALLIPASLASKIVATLAGGCAALYLLPALATLIIPLKRKPTNVKGSQS